MPWHPPPAIPFLPGAEGLRRFASATGSTWGTRDRPAVLPDRNSANGSYAFCGTARGPQHCPAPGAA